MSEQSPPRCPGSVIAPRSKEKRQPPTELYGPQSSFLWSLISDETSIEKGRLASENLATLFALMREGEQADRDWATFLLSQSGLDTQSVREALLCAARDEDEYVRAEAILGLAHRDRSLALPFVADALDQEDVAFAVFEAAELLADASLFDRLSDFASETAGGESIDRQIDRALAACSNLLDGSAEAKGPLS